ncbi:hypothetical protein [Pseudomonas syringae]|uniref:hypothetical protein n=1 Tax=Pseudomonas syringae TaxID=317 RepID=UPI003F751D6A
MGLESIHFFLKCIGWTGIVLVAMSTIGLQVTTAKLDAFKSRKIDDLVSGKNILIEKVGDYQKQIEEKQIQIDILSRKAINSERGVRKIFTFNGACKSQHGNKFGLIVGEEVNKFQALCELYNSQKWSEVISMATAIIKSNDEWLTPYYLRGISYANISDFDSAEQDLAYVVSHAGDDPDYIKATEDLAKVKECQAYAKKPQ